MSETKTLVVATGNKGKLADFRENLGFEGFEYKTLKDIGFDSEIEESALTFAGNAVIKVRAVAKFLHEKGEAVWVLADDSGLEVFALGGEPGVFSARYCGHHGSDLDNNSLLLKNMENVADRSARYVCALALLHSSTPDAEPLIFEGECRGEILKAPIGEKGFGYDPLFRPLNMDRAFAQMEFSEKKNFSHRGNALRKLAAANIIR